MTTTYSISDLFIVCSHGRRSAHEPEKGEIHSPTAWCPGGRPVTLEDLEGLGEKVWWCCYPPDQWEDFCKPNEQHSDWHATCGWYLLIPYIQQIAVANQPPQDS